MSPLSFYSQVVQALMVVDLQEQHIEPLAAMFPPPRYYADPEMMRDSRRHGTMFNLVDTQEGVKADMVPLSGEPASRLALDRRVRRRFDDPDGGDFEAWCARPEDIIVGKLQAWTQGRSAKHPADVLDMLVFLAGGASGVALDPNVVTAAVAPVSTEALALWRELPAKRDAELRKSGGGD
jgi:hypothetical protein